jgi:Zn-dependent M16 (insulinase) family peptidase
MKGAMSSPDQVLARSLLNALYPSTTYRYNSGGDPAEMPNLTHEQLVAFHRRHYHPSNAFFYTYGNLPLNEHLAFIQAKVLKHFERIDPDTAVPSQPRWDEPRCVTYRYPLDEHEDPTNKCQICIGWLMADIVDAFEILVLKLIEQILIGNSASPLRKALIDSQLGSALSDATGFDADNRDSLFVCGLKDVPTTAAAPIEQIIFDTLQNLVAEGIDPELIESAIHQIEFHRKEITNTPYPFGIKLLLSFSGSWFHGGDPVKVLNFDDDLQRLRHEIAQGAFFEARLDKYFLKNPHRVLLTLQPDTAMAGREISRVADELATRKEALQPADIETLVADAQTLQALQEAETDVSCLPTLQLEDIPPAVDCVAPTITSEPTPATCYRQPTSGIFYFTSAWGVGGLEERLLPLVPFFCYALPKSGTALRDFAAMARRIDLYTGGVSMATHARRNYSASGRCLPFVTMNGKCLVRNQDQLFDIISEMLLQFQFDDLSRIKSLLLEFKAGMEAAIIHNGHRLAISLASRNFSQTAALGEIWQGIHQIKTLKSFTDKLSEDRLAILARDLISIARSLFAPANLKMAVIGGAADVETGALQARKLQKKLESGPSHSRTEDFNSPLLLKPSRKVVREGWSTSSAVSFVAQTIETVNMRHADAPALAVISKMLRSLYLHREIREKGGAYGGFAVYNPETGLFSFGSYRDPHIVSTLKVYEGAAQFIQTARLNQEDIKEAILQVCSEIDKPDPPGPAARKAFYRHIVSLSDEIRLTFKRKLLALTHKQVLDVAAKYFQDVHRQSVAVISNEDQLKNANQKLDGHALELFRI